jgi:hypothetical protein
VACAIGKRQIPWRPRASDVNSSAALSGVHITCVVA